MSIIDRLRTFMTHVGMSNSQFADAAGIPRPTLSQLLNGRNKSVNDAFLRKLNDAFPNLDVRWLLFGLGDMLVDSNIEISETQNSANRSNPERQSTIFERVEPFNPGICTTPSESSNNSNPQFSQRNRPEEHPHCVNQCPAEPVQPMNVTSPVIDQTLQHAFNSIPGTSAGSGVAGHLESPSQQQTDESGKRIASIIVLYSDNSFETFRPSDIK